MMGGGQVNKAGRGTQRTVAGAEFSQMEARTGLDGKRVKEFLKNNEAQLSEGFKKNMQDVMKACEPNYSIDCIRTRFSESETLAKLAKATRRNHKKSFTVPLHEPGTRSSSLTIASAKNQDVSIQFPNYDPSVTGVILAVESREPFLLFGKAIGCGNVVIAEYGRVYFERINLKDTGGSLLLTPTAPNQQFTFQTLRRLGF